jgi:hypothetical protein
VTQRPINPDATGFGGTSRRIEPELLDHLPAEDPRAVRGRRDLKRINIWMGNARILARALASVPFQTPPRNLAEIGGGDGTLLLALARRLQQRWPKTHAKVVDRQAIASAQTLAAFRDLGWSAEVVQSDVFAWISTLPEIDVLIANLFLHHFTDSQLQLLFAQAAEKAKVLVACEPKRFTFPRLAGLLLRFIGCSAVGRHDAVVSVQAGFAGRELSVLWPEAKCWRTEEADAGWFSHSFRAIRLQSRK